MKRFVVFPILSMYCLGVLSQNHVEVNIRQPAVLQANAGPDTIIDKGAIVQIGGSPTATGGSGEYSFSWTPSDHVSDPAVSNPNAIPQDPMTYYVTVTDAMGCTSMDSAVVTVVEPTSLPEQEAAAQIKIMPNPNPGSFTIELDHISSRQEIQIMIMDIAGRPVYVTTREIREGRNLIPVHIPDLAKGNYLIDIECDALPFKQKIIVH